MPKIPAIYREIEQLILVPSYSVSQKLIKEVSDRKFKLSTGPLLADCYRPQHFDTENFHNLIISQFIGAIGPNYIINLLSEFKLKRVLFLGSAGAYSNKNLPDNNPDFNVCFPNLFLPCWEDAANMLPEKTSLLKVENILRNSECEIPINHETSVSSINLPTYLNLNLVDEIHKGTNIRIYDMEAAFIAEQVKNLGISFGCALFITDHHQATIDTPQSVQLAAKSPNFKEVLEYTVSLT